MVQGLSRAFSARTLLILVPRAPPLGFPESRLRRCDCRSFPINKVRQAPHGRDVSFCLDQKLWREIEKLAHEDLRSINGEIEFLLKRAVEERRGKGKENSE
jgi:hypothetical protein